VKQKRTVQRQDLDGDRVVHRDIFVKKHTIRRLVFPLIAWHVPVHAPRQACAKGDRIVTALRRRHLVASQLQNPSVLGDSDNSREALAGAGIGRQGLEWLADQGAAPRSDHGFSVNVRFVGDDDASVRNVSLQSTVGDNQRQAALAGQSFYFNDREANQTQSLYQG